VCSSRSRRRKDRCGTRALLKGSNFAPRAAMQAFWETSVGSRVSGDGFATQEKAIDHITADADGRIESTLRDSRGRRRAAPARSAQRQKRGRPAPFRHRNQHRRMSPRSGPAGTPVSIHLKGVGWTEYDNIYVATYDNAYMGYVCGFNSHGDVVINFTATGEPGTHVIDLYPGIYQGPPTEPQQLYRLPQLTYADDHPGNNIPALRFAFEVMATPPRAVTVTRN
jgi:hypothetical protein